MAAGSSAVLTNFLTNLYLFLACFGAFSILRLRPWARRFFAARRYAKDIDLKPKRLPNGYLSWIIPVLTYKEEDIIDEAGLDCAMYLRILRFGVYQGFGLSVFCIIVVLPPNMTGTAIDAILAAGNATANATVINGNQLTFTDFDHYSLSNVEPGSNKMWAHMVALYFVVLYTLWLLWRFNKESVLLRLLFLGNSKRGGPSHTLLVTDIPGVTEAVTGGLRAEYHQKHMAEKAEKKRLEMEMSQSFRKNGRVEDSYVELEGGPAAIAQPDAGDTSVPSAPKRKSVTIAEPEATSDKPTSLPPIKGAQAQGAPAVAGNGTHAQVTVSPFAGDGGKEAAAVAAADDDCDSSGDDSDAGTPGGTKRKFSLNELRSGDSKYRLVVDVDPQYAATGGKLVPARIGKDNEEILKELEVVEPEDLLKTLPANLGVDTRPLPPDRRNTKRYQYDVTAAMLDPELEAKKLLQSGLTPQQMVAQEFALVYTPNNVAAVNMIMDTSALEPLAREYNQIAMELEDYIEMAKLRLKLRKAVPQRKTTMLCMLHKDWDYAAKFNTKWFVKVDVVEYWLERMKYLRERIKVEQARSSRRVAPSAFVSLNTRSAQAIGANSLHSHDENAWRVQNAPAPFEVVWSNLTMTMPVRSGRMYFLWAVFWLMTLFFMVPVAAIQAMIEVPKLAKIPVLGPIVTAPAVQQFLQAIIPGLVLKIFLAIVPIILRIMAMLSGATSVSEIDFGVVKRFFVFQVIVVFFGSIIAGSFFNQLQQWVDDPSSVIPTLGKAIPMTSTFFITYILVNGLGVKSFAFIRLPNFVIFWVLSKFAGSPRARQRMWMYQYTNNGTTVVDHTICLLLSMTFSCINPIVCVCSLAYFLVSLLGETYNNLYVVRREYESAGRLWQTVYNQVMVGLYIMQLTMLGLLSIKKFKFSPFVFPILIFSIACHLTTLQLFSRPWSVTALHDASMMDMVEADERRMILLEAARDERKKKREKVKRAYDEAVRLAENNGDPPPPYDPRLDEPLLPGKAEKLLTESLGGDGFAMNSDEKKEIAEMYMNPAFKVKLEDVERLAKVAREVQERMPKLNEWVKQYKSYRLEVKKMKIKGDTDILPPPKMPEDLTLYDEDPNLQDSDDESATLERNAGGSVMPVISTDANDDKSFKGNAANKV